MRSVGDRVVRAVVDTNLFFSGATRPAGVPGEVIRQWRAEAFRIVLSSELADEYLRVLRRPELAAHGLTPSSVEELIAAVLASADRVSVIHRAPIRIRDPKDEMVLATAMSGATDFLVTGDIDLLTVRGDARLGSLTIVTPREFLDFLIERRR
jgi:putative PIN family toxin of toxin-antitoxin system